MALRTMAAKLKIRWPFAASQPPAPAKGKAKEKTTATTSGSNNPAGAGFSEEFSQAMVELAELTRKSRRDEELVRVAGVGLAALTLSLGIRRLSSNT